MGLLLDTNAFLWWIAGGHLLSHAAYDAIADSTNRVFFSAVCSWEIAIKLATGKLRVTPDATTWLPDELQKNHFIELPITVAHTMAVEHLSMHHRDPFDRLLIAQAMEENLTIVTRDASFSQYAVSVIRA
ncbi:MAG: type II toxin-antitoxin system VapC family toxin [Chloroflexi bacterium]|nr:type II toxin-antitoxin system VapC family toxin [Chloroflexota bacterium]